MAKTESTIDEIIAENALLHQRLAMQKIINSGVAKELLSLHEVNSSLRRIIAYILLQNDGMYRVQHKTLVAGDRYVGDLNMDVDSITGDWVLSIKQEQANVKD